MSRRDFLKVSGGGLAGAYLLAACGGFSGSGGGAGGGANEIIFYMGPDQSGELTKLVDQYNKTADVKVTYQAQAADTGQYFDKLRTQFQAGGGPDVIGGDVIWPAQLAANNWILDLTDRFTDTADYIDGPIQSNTFQDKVWGVPWFTDAGLLYFRADLLEKAGFSEPPKTWTELTEMAQKIQKDEGIKYGMVFQGADYEGGVVDGLEFIWNAGGDVLDANDESKVVIDSPESATGLETERSLVSDGLAPESVVNFKEQESQTAFLRGDSVFMRNWPYVYGLASDPAQSSIKPNQIGISTIPTTTGDVGSSGLGGWNFFINAQSENTDAAFDFVTFMSSEETQRTYALKGGFLPTRKSLYEDKAILKKVPVVRVGGDALTRTRPRPVSPVYSDMSLEMAKQFNDNLKGVVSADEAVSNLQSDLQEIVDQTQ